MRHQSDDEGVAPLLQSACAVIGSLLLVGVLAYAMASAGLDFAGELPPGSELWANWQTFR
jgi:hypothetical protein